MKKIISILLLLALVLSFAACEGTSVEAENSTEEANAAPTQDVTDEPAIQYVTPIATGYVPPEDFRFSLVYGVLGDLTYDSETGVLVKQRVATHVEDYTTTYFFTEEQKEQVYNLIVAMDPASYPDEYNPIADGIASEPSYEIVLTVTYNGVTKTITCHNIAIGAEAKDEQGENFLAVIDAIREILYASDEWQALPEYEFLYA
ncbi:MAG: hypothetical protein IJJ99_01255 [Oscillospiraceae bacterium]|nr:hypothetical protein [Oscillospiraceae bacterium]